ncbi:MAG: hypothetical protein AB7O96_13470 [Pseudobdellovibrionaceae bacterium]
MKNFAFFTLISIFSVASQAQVLSGQTRFFSNSRWTTQTVKIPNCQNQDFSTLVLQRVQTSPIPNALMVRNIVIRYATGEKQYIAANTKDLKFARYPLAGECITSVSINGKSEYVAFRRNQNALRLMFM